MPTTHQITKTTSIISSLSALSIINQSALSPRRSFTPMRSNISVESGEEPSASRYSLLRHLRTSKVILVSFMKSFAFSSISIILISSNRAISLVACLMFYLLLSPS